MKHYLKSTDQRMAPPPVRWVDFGVTPGRYPEQRWKHQCRDVGALVLTASQLNLGEYRNRGVAAGCAWCGDCPPSI